MNDKWKIHVLNFGQGSMPKEFVTPGMDKDVIITAVYVGLYLTNGKNKVIIDTGLAEEFVQQCVFSECPDIIAGEAPIIKALGEIGVEPSEIDTVIYTHLHNEHAGNCQLFKNATHVFQYEEWLELIDPLPSMKPLNYDQGVIPKFAQLKCERVHGDIDYMDGLKLVLTPGHSKGSQSIIIDTKDGKYTFVGDLVHIKQLMFADQDTMINLDGSELKVTPAPGFMNGVIPHRFVYDHYAWYKAIYNMKAMFKDPSRVIAGHDPCDVGKVFG